MNNYFEIPFILNNQNKPRFFIFIVFDVTVPNRNIDFHLYMYGKLKTINMGIEPVILNNQNKSRLFILYLLYL